MRTLSVITGTTHGIGRVTAGRLAQAGHEVVMLCRDAAAGSVVAAQIHSQIPGAVLHDALSQRILEWTQLQPPL